jgi:hypothetical protein
MARPARPRKAHLVHQVPEDGWHAWQSSNVLGGNWRGDGILWIRFNDSYYVHSGIPEDVWKGLLAAPSKGKYYAAVIRGKYAYVGPIAA